MKMEKTKEELKDIKGHCRTSVKDKEFNLSDRIIPRIKTLNGCGRKFEEKGSFLFCGYPSTYKLCSNCLINSKEVKK